MERWVRRLEVLLLKYRFRITVIDLIISHCLLLMTPYLGFPPPSIRDVRIIVEG